MTDDIDYDGCLCGHVRNIHEPECSGRYASGKWVKNPDRDCNCNKFVLDYVYKEPDTCPTCGRPFDD